MMEQEHKRQDMKIAGAGSASGGYYNKVRIDGAGRVDGDVDCESFVINGSANVSGSVATQSMVVNGSGSVKGSLQSEDLEVAGNLNIKGNLRSRSIGIDGHTSVKGDSESESLEVNGNLRVHGDVRSEKATFNGLFNIDGRLHVGSAHIQVLGRSIAREIVGDRITVRRKGQRFWDMLSINLRGNRLEARVIEGDVLDLEYVEADIVRGNRVILGKGCQVRQVEYRDEYNQHPEAEVGASDRI
ncbi:polymer-forming cytoskeletal protein [Paenibacillus sp. JCM 10914]